jgi:hypothetical protein
LNSRRDCGVTWDMVDSKKMETPRPRWGRKSPQGVDDDVNSGVATRRVSRVERTLKPILV